MLDIKAKNSTSKNFYESLELEFEKGLDYEEIQFRSYLRERKIIINEEIDLSIVNRSILNILKWNEEDEALGVPLNDRQPITIYLTTNGGCTISCFALIDAIKSSKTKVIVHGIGICASAGAFILIAGHERIANKHLTILLHDGSMAVQSSSKKAKDMVKFFDDLDLKIKDFVVSNTKISKELYESKEDCEWYMLAGEEGLSLGIIDRVL